MRLTALKLPAVGRLFGKSGVRQFRRRMAQKKPLLTAGIPPGVKLVAGVRSGLLCHR
jgi:hypothetical protein